MPVDDSAPLVEAPEEALRTPVGKRRRRLQPSVAAPLPSGWAFRAGMDVDLKLSDIAGTTTSLASSALLETTVPAAASGLVSLGPAAAVPSPGWGPSRPRCSRSGAAAARARSNKSSHIQRRDEEFFPDTTSRDVPGRSSDQCVLVSRRWPELRVAVSSGHRSTLGLGGDEGVVVVVGHAAQW